MQFTKCQNAIARNKVTARIRRDAKISTINLINESGKPWEYWKNVKKITDPQVVQKWNYWKMVCLYKMSKN